jgi:phospholipase/carboxylesterase
MKEKLAYTAHIPDGDEKFPTILALHGWGANAHDLLGLAPMLVDGRAVMLCPQGPVKISIGPGMAGYGWFPLDPSKPIDIAAFERSADALREFVADALEKFPIDPDRIVVAGFSQGGVMAYELALREPSRFAGLAALSSWFPTQLAETLEKKPEHEGFPVLVIHGTRDSMLPIDRARESREELRPYGVSLTYREFEMAHEINREALQLITRWLNEKAFGKKE